MAITNAEAGTNVHEIADGIYRINTPVQIPGGGFSFNQYLVVDDEPLLFHTGLRKMFPLVKEAVESVIPASSLRHIAFSHVEADECGSLNEWLAAAPQAAPLCSSIAAMVSVDDLADRPPRAFQDGETLGLGRHTVQWFDTPHLPHAWECGFLMETSTETLLCGDLFTQPGDKLEPLTESDILGPSEAFRGQMDYFSHTKHLAAMIERLASANPRTLACMHGSAWSGDGGNLLRALGERLSSRRVQRRLFSHQVPSPPAVAESGDSPLPGVLGVLGKSLDFVVRNDRLPDLVSRRNLLSTIVPQRRAALGPQPPSSRESGLVWRTCRGRILGGGRI